MPNQRFSLRIKPPTLSSGRRHSFPNNKAEAQVARTRISIQERSHN